MYREVVTGRSGGGGEDYLLVNPFSFEEYIPIITTNIVLVRVFV